MVRQIKLNQIDDVMKEVVVDLVQATTLNWTARVKKATPVFSSDNYTQSELDALPEFFKQSTSRILSMSVWLITITPN